MRRLQTHIAINFNTRLRPCWIAVCKDDKNSSLNDRFAVEFVSIYRKNRAQHGGACSLRSRLAPPRRARSLATSRVNAISKSRGDRDSLRFAHHDAKRVQRLGLNSAAPMEKTALNTAECVGYAGMKMRAVLTAGTVVLRTMLAGGLNCSRFQKPSLEFHEIAEVVTIGKVRAIGAVCMPEKSAANSAQLVRPSPQLAIKTGSDSPWKRRTLTPFGGPCRVVGVVRTVGFRSGFRSVMTAAITRLEGSDVWSHHRCLRLPPLPRNRSRKSNSRIDETGSLVLLSTVVIPVLLGLVLAGFQVIRADDDGDWRISGRALNGLGSAKSRPTVAEQGSQSNRWMANVPETAWEYIVIHHSAGTSGSVESIHKEHVQRKDSSGNRWLGIGYHFVIGNGHGMKDGEVQATFRWNEQIHGAHSGNAMFNARGIGICLIGNFEDHPPTPAQVKAIRDLVKTLTSRHHISKTDVIGHGSVKATACPGKHFPLKELRDVVPGS